MSYFKLKSDINRLVQDYSFLHKTSCMYILMTGLIILHNILH